ncbi:MAG: hypothetical protein KJ653_08095 [Candidatus Thermoplasmatota archaeon]|nr:hypothetical protein [Candidatus Thermoplasmatota archaeon]
MGKLKQRLTGGRLVPARHARPQRHQDRRSRGESLTDFLLPFRKKKTLQNIYDDEMDRCHRSKDKEERLTCKLTFLRRLATIQDYSILSVCQELDEKDPRWLAVEMMKDANRVMNSLEGSVSDLSPIGREERQKSMDEALRRLEELKEIVSEIKH